MHPRVCLDRFLRSLSKQHLLVRKLATLSFVGLGMVGQSEAQITNLSFEQLSVEEGFPDPMAACMMQDSKGFIWFGTPAGFHRYDGQSFRLFDDTPTAVMAVIREDRRGYIWHTGGGNLHRLDPATGKVTRYFGGSAMRAHLILEDASGDLWVTTRGNGLALYVPSADSFHLFVHRPGDTTSLCNDTIWALCEDRQGGLWIGTPRGLDHLEKGTKIFTHPAQLRHDTVECVLEDENNAIWIGTNDGLCRYEPASGRLDRFKNRQLVHNYVGAMCLTRRNEIWIGIGGRIARFDRSVKQFIMIKGSPPDTAIGIGGYPNEYFLEDRQGRLWVSTWAGLALFDQMNNVLHVFKRRPEDSRSMAEGALTAMMQDHSRNLWFGTLHSGVCRLDGTRNPFVHIAQHPYDKIQLSHTLVSAILEDSAGFLWVGSHHGLDRFELSTGSKTHFDYDRAHRDGFNFSDREIYQIIEDGPELLWLATGGGLCKLNRKTGGITRYLHQAREAGMDASQTTMSVCIDSAGTMWVGGGVASGLLMRFDRTSEEYSGHYFVDLPGNSGEAAAPIGIIYEDNAGTLWFKGRELDAFDRATGDIRRYCLDTTSLWNHHVTSICEDAAGVFWIGSSLGLHRFERATGTFIPAAGNERLAGRQILEILEGHSRAAAGTGQAGNLWLLTEQGISRYTPSTGDVKHYGPAEGVPVAASWFVRASSKTPDGYVYFGGTNGFVKFHPDSLHDNTFVPPIVITSFKKFNVEAELDSTVTAKKVIELSHDEHDISFEYAALSYTRPEKNQYAYKLEGYDRDWIFCGFRRTAMYTNLDPGTYQFRVKGSNNEGLWNEAGTSVLVIIDPPFWRTWWAYLAYVLVAAGLLNSAFRFQRNRLLLRHEVEVKDIEARRLREVEHMKSRFFANISHEFRTPLTLILGPVHKWQERVQEEDLKKDLSMAERNAHRLLRLINQLLDLSKLEAGGMKLHARSMNIVPLIKGIAYSFESSAGMRAITLNVCVDDEEIRTFCDKDIVEKILGNLLTNALKFTPQGGSVEVRVKQVAEGNGWVEISVSDTGVGIAEEHRARIFDRFYQVDDSPTRAQGGTGIGLALVKELVGLHHGTISVESAVGAGTTFTIRLPLGKEHLKPEEIAEVHEEENRALPEEPRDLTVPGNSQSAQGQTAHVVRQGERELILVVEDNSDVREYIRDNLPKSYRVLEAADGSEGIEKARETIPDVVLSDVMMPGKDGYELCRTLKNDERTCHIPVILLTAKAASESKLQGLETGADDYLIKPFEPKELQARIRNLIELRRKLRERFSVAVPLKPGEVAVTSMDDAFLKNVMAAVERHMGEEHFYTDELAREVGVSRVQLHRKLTALTNQSPGEFARYLRLHRAMDLLRQNAGTISEIAFSVGFSDHSHFSKCFHKQFGKSPTEFKNEVESHSTPS